MSPSDLNWKTFEHDNRESNCFTFTVNYPNGSGIGKHFKGFNILDNLAIYCTREECKQVIITIKSNGFPTGTVTDYAADLSIFHDLLQNLVLRQGQGSTGS